MHADQKHQVLDGAHFGPTVPIRAAGGGETVDKVARHLERQGTNLGGPGCYEIILAADAQIANGPKGDRQLETLDQWMKETAARWPPLRGRSRSENPRAVDRFKTEQPEDWQSMVTLQRYHAWYASGMKRTPGSVKLFGRRTPTDLETAQRLTVERAFEKKTEKLEKAAEVGGRTVLVFEAEQLAFDNLENIGTSLRGLPRGLTERIDDVILVETRDRPMVCDLPETRRLDTAGGSTAGRVDASPP